MAGEASDAELRESWRIWWPAYFAEPEDAPPFPEDLEVSAAALAGVLAGAGHAPWMERPGSVASAPERLIDSRRSV